MLPKLSELTTRFEISFRGPDYDDLSGGAFGGMLGYSTGTCTAVFVRHGGASLASETRPRILEWYDLGSRSFIKTDVNLTGFEAPEGLCFFRDHLAIVDEILHIIAVCKVSPDDSAVDKDACAILTHDIPEPGLNDGHGERLCLQLLLS